LEGCHLSKFAKILVRFLQIYTFTSWMSHSWYSPPEIGHFPQASYRNWTFGPASGGVLRCCNWTSKFEILSKQFDRKNELRLRKRTFCQPVSPGWRSLLGRNALRYFGEFWPRF